MKKLILIVGILIIAVGTSNAGILSWFGLGGDTKIETEVNTLKDSVQKTWSDINPKLSALSDNVIKLTNQMTATDNQIGVLRDNQLKLEAKIKANVGYSKETNTTTTQSGTGNVNNDTGLLTYIFEIFSGISLAIIAALGTIVRMQGKTITELNEYANELASERDKQYNELVDFQSDMLKKLLESKEQYKAKYFEIINGNKIS